MLNAVRKLDQPGAATTTVTSVLLACGVVAGPLYVIVTLIQALTRDGFDLTRHAASMLMLGVLGWVQVTNFVVAGLLTVACAVGMRRVLRGGRAGTWGPPLIGTFGAALILAAIFAPDAALGFPPGTPAGPAEVVTVHGALHLVAGSVGFLGLVAACFVVARGFAAHGRWGWAAHSIATGVVFFVAFAAIASGQATAWSNVVFGVAVVISWTWVSVMAARLRAGKALAS